VFAPRQPKCKGRHRSTAGRSALAAALVICVQIEALAFECAKEREPRIPPAPEAIINIDILKKQLRDYHAGDYFSDIGLVLDEARKHIEQRVNQVKMPAVVLDIDETSLSNWANISANDFGFIKGGPCTEQPNLACGFDEWILKASAPALPPTLLFYNAIAKNVAVFFITGRRNSQRGATIWNLDVAGFHGWARLMTRPDDDTNRSIVPFKSGERAKIEAEGYRIIANIGDQKSDLAGDFAECGFKLPNPFYFIK